jgi:DNA-binding NtrC family response regulator
VKDAGDSAAHYRLRGEVGGAARSYPLRAGENSVGSTSANTIVLPLRGVSRRHAVLTLEPGGLTLQDLGSKNGTLVRGRRVQRARLQPGDDIRVGPVTLRVEEVEPEDATMAIRLDGDDAPAIGLSDGDTTATAMDEPGRISAGLLERLVAHACESAEPDLSAIVTLLASGFEATSACVFETSAKGPVVLAACGPVPDLERPEDEPALASVVAPGSGDGRLGIALAGRLRFARGDVEAVLHLLLTLLQRLRTRRGAAVAPRRREPRDLVFPEGYVPGDSPAMRSFYAQVRPLVDGDLPVLLLGETGVGKECLARMLHDSSPRRGGPFVAVNCAAIPADLLEAEMFGIGRGVATGVVERRGRFQMAEGGTLFLDEIGDMPLELQAKILRALQEKEVQPVGGAAVPVDIRVVAATNSDLHRRMQEGRFRRDLYFRVAGLALHVPSLRERREDVPALVEGFLRTFAAQAGRSVAGITVKALRALMDHAWPGNVRELEHEVRRLVYLCPPGQAIDSTLIAPEIRAGAAAGGAAGPASLPLDLQQNVDATERRLIREALERAGGNRSHAARLLGISRNGLAIKMERLGIHPSG